MISKYSIESAYCFFHQKERVYAHSTLGWQRDDIEQAIASYTDEMSPELYALLSQGNSQFLRSHAHFHEQLLQALAQLEGMLGL